MPATVKIGDRAVGPGQPCFVIAEAGVNHNGDVALAKRLVDAAADAGADAVKFQTWETEKLVARGAPLAAYQREAGAAANQFELLKGLELRGEDFVELDAHARGRGILFLSTPDEEESADLLDGLGVPAFKIGSAEVTNLPLLRHVAAKGKPVILSTGMSTLGEVEQALTALDEAGAPAVALLQCTSAYPTAAEDANLEVMATLAAAFGRPVGYSDHTLGIDVAVAAVALGACILEKHLTLDKSLAGPDHAASLEPAELDALVASVRRVEVARGDGIKRVLAVEVDSRRTMHKAIVASRPLECGVTLVADDLAFRRGGGLPVTLAGSLVGRTLRVPLDAGEPITLESLL